MTGATQTDTYLHICPLICSNNQHNPNRVQSLCRQQYSLLTTDRDRILTSTLRNFCIASVSGCMAAFASHCRLSSGRLAGIVLDFFFLPFVGCVANAANSAGVGSTYTAAPLVERNSLASVTS